MKSTTFCKKTEKISCLFAQINYNEYDRVLRDTVRRGIMLNSTAFDYVNVLDKAADASWKRENILANNIE